MKKDQVLKVCAEMERSGLAGMLIGPSEELRFLTGFSPMICERFQGLFLTAEGKSFYVCNTLYRGEMEHAFGAEISIYDWLDGESMTDAVGAALAKNGLAGKTIGVNASAQAFNILDIMNDCGVTFVNALSVLQEARIRKTASELESLRRAAQIADEAFDRVTGFIRPGLTEYDIQQFLFESMQAGGGEDCWAIIASGPNSSYPHYLGTDRVIQETDLMILDFGCTWNSMYSDMSRTVFVGDVSEEQRKIYDIVSRANAAGEAAAVNGAYIPDVDRAARSIIADAGYGAAFINRLGHGIGYLIHESPEIKKNNCRTLEPGMTFSIEPGIYLAGRFGMRIEDIVAVTAAGNEVLNKASKELLVL